MSPDASGSNHNGNDLVISPFFKIGEGGQGDEVLSKSKEVRIINITPYPLTPRPFVRYII